MSPIHIDEISWTIHKSWQIDNESNYVHFCKDPVALSNDHNGHVETTLPWCPLASFTNGSAARFRRPFWMTVNKNYCWPEKCNTVSDDGMAPLCARASADVMMARRGPHMNRTDTRSVTNSNSLLYQQHLLQITWRSGAAGEVPWYRIFN